MEYDQINPNQKNQQEPRGEAENQELHYQPNDRKNENLKMGHRSVSLPWVMTKPPVCWPSCLGKPII